MERSVGKLAANAGQPCRKGRIRVRTWALEAAYDGYRSEGVNDYDVRGGK